MSLQLPAELLAEIHAHGALSYPEEGAGFLLGRAEGEQRTGVSILPIANAREDGARHNRYLIGPKEMMLAENAADAASLTLLGIFHSHPDHPSEPSEFDRDWALPFFSYLITRVEQGKAIETRSWRLADDRSHFTEELIESKEN
jgi:proteasome lid subunit RPN8/RPN11